MLVVRHSVAFLVEETTAT